MMKKLFAWMILSLMSITAVMPNFVQFQNQTPQIQVQKDDKSVPTVAPDNPTPNPEPEEELGPVISYSEAISSTTAFNNYVTEKTAELNANCLNSITVDPSDASYRGNELPSGFTQIEYLESSGSQYINTGIFTDYKTNFEIDFLTTNTFSTTYNANGSGYGYIFGSANDRLSLNTYPATNGGELYYFNRAINPYITSGVRTQISLIGNTFTTSNGTQNIDRGSFSASATSLKIFSNATNGSCGHVKLYSFKIYDDTTLVRDFVPVMRKSDNILGLYDKVHNQFYTNQGTGTFIGA